MTQLQYYTHILAGMIAFFTVIGSVILSFGFVAAVYYFHPWFVPSKKS